MVFYVRVKILIVSEVNFQQQQNEFQCKCIMSVLHPSKLSKSRRISGQSALKNCVDAEERIAIVQKSTWHCQVGRDDAVLWFDFCAKSSTVRATTGVFGRGTGTRHHPATPAGPRLLAHFDEAGLRFDRYGGRVSHKKGWRKTGE